MSNWFWSNRPSLNGMEEDSKRKKTDNRHHSVPVIANYTQYEKTHGEFTFGRQNSNNIFINFQYALHGRSKRRVISILIAHFLRINPNPRSNSMKAKIELNAAIFRSIDTFLLFIESVCLCGWAR